MLIRGLMDLTIVSGGDIRPGLVQTIAIQRKVASHNSMYSEFGKNFGSAFPTVE